MDYQVTCPHCRANIGVMAVHIGRMMHCPYCKRPMTVSSLTDRDPSIPLGRIFSFHCSQCGSRLEAYSSMVGQRGQCPTCAVQFEIPSPGGGVERLGGTQAETQYAQPVHAYAAAGDKAPEIFRLPSGQQAIRCPRCHAVNSVDRNNCATCATPFTLEGAGESAQGRSGGLAVSSLILGIIGLPGFWAVAPSVLAVIFGLIVLLGKGGYKESDRNQAIAGVILGVLGLGIMVVWRVM